jgi:hypothetical protein
MSGMHARIHGICVRMSDMRACIQEIRVRIHEIRQCIRDNRTRMSLMNARVQRMRACIPHIRPELFLTAKIDVAHVDFLVQDGESGIGAGLSL